MRTMPDLTPKQRGAEVADYELDRLDALAEAVRVGMAEMDADERDWQDALVGTDPGTGVCLVHSSQEAIAEPVVDPATVADEMAYDWRLAELQFMGLLAMDQVVPHRHPAESL